MTGFPETGFFNWTLGRRNPLAQDQFFPGHLDSTAEEEVIADFTKVGLNQFLTQSELQDRWDSLSHREKQVVALVCLGSRNYEIAQTLGIAPETVKTHLQHVYDKLHLRSRKELRLALKDWDFQDWWEHNRHE